MTLAFELAGRAFLLVRLVGEGVVSPDAGVLFFKATNGAFDFGCLFETAGGDSFLKRAKVFEKTFFGSRDHGDFFFPTLRAAAENELAVGVFGVGDFEDFDLLVGGTSGECFEGFLLKMFGVFAAAPSGDINEVVVASCLEQGEVGAGGKAGVEDDDGLVFGGGGLAWAALIQALEHALEGDGVGGVSFKNFVAERETVFVKSHADGDLAAVVTFLFIFAVFGLGVGLGEAFEVGVGDVVEDDAALEIEEVFFVLAELFFDLFAMLHEGVAGAVKAVFGGFADSGVQPQRYLMYHSDSRKSLEERNNGGVSVPKMSSRSC